MPIKSAKFDFKSGTSARLLLKF